MRRLLIGIGVVLSVSLALGQGFRGGGGDRGRGDRPLSPEEIAQRLTRTEDFLRKMDTNGNGMLDAEEVTSSQAKFMVQRVFSRLGKEPKYPIAISEIKQSLTTYYQTRGTGGGPPSGNMPPRFSGPGDAKRPPVGPGFGEPKPPPSAIAGFGEAPAPGAKAVVISGPPNSSGPPSSSAQPSSSGPSASQSPAGAAIDPAIDQKIRSLAAAIIQKYDKSSDGKLDREEWPSQGRWGTFNEANRSGGTSVGLQDLIVHLTDLYRRQQLSLVLPDSGAASGTTDSATSGSAKPISRKSGRFLTPKERLPKGLPDWFLQKDADGDGQVLMAEFATDWTPGAAAEFARYDLNRDGIITAAECLKVEKRSTSKSQ